MLILTRRAGETVMIGDEIRFTVVSIKWGQVRVGIGAPKSVVIRRGDSRPRTKRQSSPPLDEPKEQPSAAMGLTPP